MFKHPNRDNSIIPFFRPGCCPVIAQQNGNPILQPSVLDSLLCQLLLFFRERESSNTTAVFLGSSDHDIAPSAAYFEQMVAGREVQSFQ